MKAALLVAAFVAAIATRSPALDGNALLRAVAKQPLPRTYAVPIHFRVHIHHPIGIVVGADAITYFRAPGDQALVITSLPRIIGNRIARSYGHLDTVPQAWARNYRVTQVTSIELGGEPAYRLDAVPRYRGGIDHVTFDLLRRGLVPVGAEWTFSDGSSVRLSVRNERVGRYLLPAHEDIAVSMPRFTVDAAGDNGPYALNAAIPETVFAQ